MAETTSIVLFSCSIVAKDDNIGQNFADSLTSKHDSLKEIDNTKILLQENQYQEIPTTNGQQFCKYGFLTMFKTC